MGLNAGGNSMRGRPGRGRGNNSRFHPGNNLDNSNDSSQYNPSTDQMMQRPKYKPTINRGRGGGGGVNNGNGENQAQSRSESAQMSQNTASESN